MGETSREPEALAPTMAATPTPMFSSAPAATPEETLIPGEVLGERYRIVELVGRGGQGDVYRAEDLEVTGHVVALKLMHRASRNDTERDFATRELRMLAAVTHPAIVQFKDSGWYGARLWFVMPWLNGHTLEREGQLSRAEARRIFETVTAGVAALHAKGMRHQDIKPSNIFLARIDGFDERMPILLDLGVAAREDDALVAGSPDYFAPEVAAGWPTGGDAEIGPAADVYALALTLRNMLDPDTAQKVDPFSKQDLSLRAKVLVPPPGGREHQYLRSYFERWLSIDPARRPTAEELMHELAVLTEPEDRRRDRIKTLRRIAPYMAVLAVMALIVGYFVSVRLTSQAKAAALAAEEQRAAELQAEAARVEAQTARELERQALERAAHSEAEADRAEAEAHEALDRVQRAQRSLRSVQGDRARLQEALEELQAAVAAAEAARQAEQQARIEERTEANRVLQATREAIAEERRTSAAERARLEASIAALEARAAESETRETAERARAESAEEQRRALEQRAAELEARAAELQGRAQELEARIRRLEAGRPSAPAGSPALDPAVPPSPSPEVPPEAVPEHYVPGPGGGAPGVSPGPPPASVVIPEPLPPPVPGPAVPEPRPGQGGLIVTQ